MTIDVFSNPKVIDLSCPIGEGHRGTAYLQPDSTVFKLLDSRASESSVLAEYHIARLAHTQGVDTPNAVNILRIENQLGIVFEFAKGDTVSRMVLTKPWKLVAATKRTAEVLAQIHAVKVSGLRPVKRALRRRIERVPELSQAEKVAALKVLERLEDGESLCHFDYHPANVLTDGSSYKVIDWGAAKMGTPFADLAHTFILNLVDGTLTDVPRFNQLLVRSMRGAYLQLFLFFYARSVPDLTYWEVRRQIRQWIIPIAASRLASYGDFETKKLLKIIKKEINRVKRS